MMVLLLICFILQALKVLCQQLFALPLITCNENVMVAEVIILGKL